MTGRDLVIYIVSNGLEDEPIYSDSTLLGLLTIEDVSKREEVGTATVYAWIKRGMLDSVSIGDAIFVPVTYKTPERRSDRL